MVDGPPGREHAQNGLSGLCFARVVLSNEACGSPQFALVFMGQLGKANDVISDDVKLFQDNIHMRLYATAGSRVSRPLDESCRCPTPARFVIPRPQLQHRPPHSRASIHGRFFGFMEK